MKAIRQKEEQLAQDLLIVKQKLSELEHVANSRGLSGLFRSSSVPEQRLHDLLVWLKQSCRFQLNQRLSCPISWSYHHVDCVVPLTIMGWPHRIWKTRVYFGMLSTWFWQVVLKCTRCMHHERVCERQNVRLIQMSCCGGFLFYAPIQSLFVLWFFFLCVCTIRV